MNIAVAHPSTAPSFSAEPFVKPRRRFTVEEYVQREIETNEKHYFLNGTLLIMPGGTPPHVRISGNVFISLTNKLEGQPQFEVFSNDMKIVIPAFKIYNYADACTVCGEAIFTQDAAQALTNPILIVEVLSKSTRGYDQKRKFEEYKTIPTFREYVLIEQDKPLVKSWFKGDDGEWKISGQVSDLDSSVFFESVRVSISMSKIYRNVSFETA